MADGDGTRAWTRLDDGGGADTAPAVRAAVLAAALLIAQQVAGKATRDALFLSHFDVTTLPLASGATALLSLGAVLAFARAMAALSPARIMPLVLGVGGALLVGEWGLSFAFPRAAALAVYLHMGLFGATLVSGFWSLVNERFDPHTAKRVVGPIGTGASVGGIVGGLVTWRLAKVVSVPTMLLVMAGVHALCLRSLLRLRPPDRRFRTEIRPPRETGEVSPSGVRLIGKLPYLRHLALFVGLGAFVDAMVDWVFNSAAAASFARGGPLMSFFALFHTAVGVLSLAAQASAVRPALERLGLAGTIAIQPAVLGLTAGLVLWFPRLWGIVLLRGSNVVLRSSLLRSGYELLYTPLLQEQKRPTKAIIDVGLDRLGTVLGSAVVMLVLFLAPASATRPLLAVAALAAGLILALVPRLKHGYVEALAQSLRSRAIRLDETEVVDATTRLTVASVEREGCAAVEGLEAANPAAPDTLLDAMADLRSGDPDRIRRVLRHEPELDPRLVSHVIPLLARDELFGETLWALRRAAPRCTGQLLDALLDPRQEPVVRRRIPRVLKASPTPRVVDGLMLGLRDERLDLRFRCAQTLVRLKEQHPALEIAPEAVFLAARREIDLGGGEGRSLDHIFTILSLSLEREPLEIALRALRIGDEALRGTALEYLENVLPVPIREGLWPRIGGAERPMPTGRSPEEVRDDLLRSTAAKRLRRTGVRKGSRAME